MRRRRFFALFGAAAAAGCSAPEAGLGTDRPTLTPVEVPVTETSTPGSAAPIQSRGQFGEASVVNLRSGPRTLALSPVRYERGDLRVELRFTTSATVAQPARLEATLTNNAEAAIRVDSATLPPFGAGVTLARPAAGSMPDTPTTRVFAPIEGDFGGTRPGVERGPEGYWRATSQPSTLPERLEFEAGETRTGRFIFIGVPGARGFPIGGYAPADGEAPLSLAVWDTGAPGPIDGSRFDGRTVPDLPNTDGTDWFHEATPRTGIFVRPAVERGDAPTTFRFTLVNHTIDPLGGNPEEWKLYKLVDGRWFRVAPWTIELSAGPIPPGGTFDYVIAAAHGAPPVCECTATGGGVGHLGGGLYALEAGYSRVRTSETYAALFRLEAPELSVTPSESATADRQETRIVVTLPEWDDGTSPADATMRVTRATDSDGARVVPEQVYRPPFRALRDVVPHLSDTPVVLRADESIVEAFVGKTGEKRKFTYAGPGYVAKTSSHRTPTPSD